MSNNKFSQDLVVYKVGGATEALGGYAKGRITKNGVVSGSSTDRNGQPRSFARFAISLRNCGFNVKYALKHFGKDETAIAPYVQNDNEYYTLNVSVWGRSADYAIKYLKAGDTVSVVGPVNLNEYNGRISLQMIAQEVIRERSNGTANTTSAEQAPTTEPATSAEPVAAPEPTAEETVVIDSEFEW